MVDNRATVSSPIERSMLRIVGKSRFGEAEVREVLSRAFGSRLSELSGPARLEFLVASSRTGLTMAARTQKGEREYCAVASGRDLATVADEVARRLLQALHLNGREHA